MLPKTFTRTLAYRGGPGSNNKTPYRLIPEGKAEPSTSTHPPWGSRKHRSHHSTRIAGLRMSTTRTLEVILPRLAGPAAILRAK
ncbi:hypothetical protein LTR22_027853, partial [Elasticomyces elasticus]